MLTHEKPLLKDSSKTSQKEAIDLDVSIAHKNPLYLIESGYLYIKTKKGELIKLECNTAQEKFFKKIIELRNAKKRVRIWLLKFRQGGFCLDPKTKVLTDDLKWVALDDIEIGQRIVAVDENEPGGKGKGRKLRVGIVESKRDLIDEAFKITMEDGRILIATGEHRFLSRRTGNTQTQWKSIRKRKVAKEALLKEGDVIRHITDTWESFDYEDGWFGGMIDGEGSIRKAKRSGYDIVLSQRPGIVCDRMKDYLFDNGYTFQERLDERPAKEGGKFSGNPVIKLAINRIDELFKLIGKTRPSRLIDKLWWQGKDLPCRSRGGKAWRKIVSIEPIGRQRMIDLQTSTKTFIAEGFVSHNSTLIEGIIYALTSQQANRNSLIMADEKEHANNLFEMSKLYHERLEKDNPHLAPPLKKSNEKKLEFDGIHSQIIIASAENTEAAKSHTFHYVHLSEVAFFRDLKTVLNDLNQTVPDHADTVIIGETTANQMNEFYKEWMRAIEGKTDWLPIFMPWFLMEEYRMTLHGGALYPLKGIKFDADSSEISFETEEQELKEEYSLTDEQINWRRWAIVNKCQGDVLTFETEYPSIWQEAFSLSGSMFFDRRGLQRQNIMTPIAIGEIYDQDMKWDFRALEHGRVEIFEYPVEGEQYIIATDASEAVGSDEAAALVLNKRTNATSAIIAGQHTPEELAHMAVALANYYNKGIIAPENKGYGYMVGQLVNKRYGNIYKRKITKKGDIEETEEIGFNTNSVTRPQYLAQLNEEIKNGSTRLNSKMLFDECNTFVIKKDKQGKVTKIEAQTGCQDGLVICRAIAGIVRQEHPYVQRDMEGDKDRRKARSREIKEKRNAGIGF